MNIPVEQVMKMLEQAKDESLDRVSENDSTLDQMYAKLNNCGAYSVFYKMQIALFEYETKQRLKGVVA